MLSFTIQQIFYKVNLFNVVLNFLDMLSKYNFTETNQQITKRETFLYVILVSGVRLISKIKFHFINVLLAQMQISNVYLLAMRKGIVSTIVLREELNSFFPIILHDEGKCHVFVDINVSENPSKRGLYS
jgi:hypothetical protein